MRELEPEEDDQIDGWPSLAGVAVLAIVTDARAIERTLKVAIEVIAGSERFNGDDDRAIELAARSGAEQGGEAFLWRG